MQYTPIEQAQQWVEGPQVSATALDASLYCETRDVFQARLDRMVTQLVASTSVLENHAYLLSAIAGEIGNNSFDHNVGKWPDIPGVFFWYDFAGAEKYIVLADRGQGILTTLRQVRPSLHNHSEALKTAFQEKVSGRAPENRGNGLKFVRQSVHDNHFNLTFFTGDARAEVNDHFEVTTAEHPIHGCLAILRW